MNKKQWHVGTSGWSYKHWREAFYPPRLPQTKWFAYYAEQFHSSEINTSFYHLPKPETVERWAEGAPPGFTFCAKMSRYVTHMKKLRQVEEPLERFFSVFASLYALMGPVLIQLPPPLRFQADVCQDFFSLLQFRYPDQCFVLEVRHESWLQEEVIALLRAYRIGFVISQSKGYFPYAEYVTSKHVYLRFHGPEALYASPYPEETLQVYADKCRQWLKDGHTVWAYFNNDIDGHAFRDAKRFQELLERESR